MTHPSTRIAALIAATVLAACGPTTADDVYDKSYSGSRSDLAVVKHEYNADLASLQAILDRASRVERRITAMEPVDHYSADDVDAYNALVNRYNRLADRYRLAATRFNAKYDAYAEGADGGVPTSPDGIDLPDPIP